MCAGAVLLPSLPARTIMYELYCTIMRCQTHSLVCAFKFSNVWYRKNAWGRDLLLPVSGGSEQWMGLGLTLVDALDTLLLMNLTAEFAEARAWIAAEFVTDQV